MDQRHGLERTHLSHSQGVVDNDLTVSVGNFQHIFWRSSLEKITT